MEKERKIRLFYSTMTSKGSSYVRINGFEMIPGYRFDLRENITVTALILGPLEPQFEYTRKVHHGPYHDSQVARKAILGGY